jgi:hypothetical protein
MDSLRDERKLTADKRHDFDAVIIHRSWSTCQKMSCRSRSFIASSFTAIEAIPHTALASQRGWTSILDHQDPSAHFIVPPRKGPYLDQPPQHRRRSAISTFFGSKSMGGHCRAVSGLWSLGPLGAKRRRLPVVPENPSRRGEAQVKSTTESDVKEIANAFQFQSWRGLP